MEFSASGVGGSRHNAADPSGWTIRVMSTSAGPAPQQPAGLDAFRPEPAAPRFALPLGCLSVRPARGRSSPAAALGRYALNIHRTARPPPSRTNPNTATGSALPPLLRSHTGPDPRTCRETWKIKPGAACAPCGRCQSAGLCGDRPHPVRYGLRQSVPQRHHCGQRTVSTVRRLWMRAYAFAAVVSFPVRQPRRSASRACRSTRVPCAGFRLRRRPCGAWQPPSLFTVER